MYALSSGYIICALRKRIFYYPSLRLLALHPSRAGIMQSIPDLVYHSFFNISYFWRNLRMKILECSRRRSQATAVLEWKAVPEIRVFGRSTLHNNESINI